MHNFNFMKLSNNLQYFLKAFALTFLQKATNFLIIPLNFTLQHHNLSLIRLPLRFELRHLSDQFIRAILIIDLPYNRREQLRLYR
jgi:hypothetical protein